MTWVILCAALIIAVAIVWSIPYSHDYHADLSNIAYQLSRIADILSRMEREE